MVVVSHLFFFFAKSFRGRCDSHESHLPLFGAIYFPTAPFFVVGKSLLLTFYQSRAPPSSLEFSVFKNFRTGGNQSEN